MMITVANPIYDAVFKYLMEDERVAKTILSALLKRDVVEVEVRKHEYTNGSRDKISMFRIDFGAKVLQDDGSLKLVLIELQKTGLETETLRFRQYLGTQYVNPDNILKDDNPKGYGIPMITVYLLGHRVGDIQVPVVYVRHKAYDYDGNEVVDGVPDPFIESLVHDSIIVQIPLLRGQINNRLEEVLSVFDQVHKDKKNRQILNIDEDIYQGDDEMNLIIRRLLSAASDTKLRQDMNVEDEYYTAIENRDTAIMLRDQKIAERDAKLAEQSTQLAEQSTQLAEKSTQFAEKSTQLAEQSTQLAERDAKLAEQSTQLAEQSTQLAEQSTQIAEQEIMLKSTIKMLLEAGIDINAIAVNLNISIDEVERMAKL